MKALKLLKKFILDILFPIQCVGCGKEGEWLCEDCFNLIKLSKECRCPICGKTFYLGKTCLECRRKRRTKLTGLIVAGSYGDKLLKETIHAFKFGFVKELVRPLSMLLIRRLEDLNFNLEKSSFLLTFVPLHKRRLRWRGFNQAEILAQSLASYYGRDLVSVLSRRRSTIPQSLVKNKEKRKKNIKNVFCCQNREQVKGKKVIIVDDVCTTASTLKECARVLSRAGAKEIWGLVLAAPRRKKKE